MTSTMMGLVLLALALMLLAGGKTYLGPAGVRARRRTAWERDRAEWRRWITRP